MSLRIKLIWAFVGVAFTALLLSFLGLNFGMYAAMGMQGGTMSHMGGTSPFTVTLQRSLWSSVAALVVAAGVGLWIAGRMTGSLLQLRDTVSQLDLRDLSRRVPVSGADEIADLARTFNRMGERLESGERARRQLLADVAHELRHPLAVMQGHLDLMQDGKVPLEPEALLPIQDEVIRLRRLVGDLRDLSLAEVGALTLHPADVDLAALLHSLVGNMEPVATARDVQLHADIAADLPPVQADADRLRQVFVNLLSNALRYTPSGGRVTLRAWRDAGHLHVQIRDTGPGIAPADLPHVFDRFYRADKSRSRETGGSGLGLAIVRSLVEAHHGKVEVESEPGRGTCFTVTIASPAPGGGRLP